MVRLEEKRPVRSDSAAFLLLVQHELAGVAVRVAEINSKVDSQSSQVQAAGATATAAMAAVVGAAAAARASAGGTASQHPSRSTSAGAAGTNLPAETDAAAATLADVQRSLAVMQERFEDLQQQLQQQQGKLNADVTSTAPEGEQHHHDVSVWPTDTLRAAASAGVLHAPLSVVVQLQQELTA
ncbi:hypothetical protein COO60DRAFT_386304 [Scenedesmus sp. NREL 46B-D3]|nr:hypothetical protein COO60DRAFT_386304 [Scenedesmus sp. NREL 46B-D3]